jgi:Domain of unknown function (DUF4372)
MNVGKTLFAQVMEYVPWKTFGRIVERYRGDAGVRTLGCADLFRVMAFSQLTWRESLRDIEVCLTANQTKLFHMGLKNIPARSTVSDALNLRDCRILFEAVLVLAAPASDRRCQLAPYERPKRRQIVADSCWVSVSASRIVSSTCGRRSANGAISSR